MKTSNSNAETFQMKELSKFQLLIVKGAIAVFGVILNVCCIQLLIN